MKKFRVRKALENYVIEITLVLLGSIVATFEAIFASGSIALIVGFLSLLLSLSVVAIRLEIASQIGDMNEDKVVLRSIPDPRWRQEAQTGLEQTRLQYSSWANGVRHVKRESSLNYQIRALDKAIVSVRAIHLANDLDALDMWVNRQRGFASFVDAYRRLSPQILCRRILVLDGSDREISVEDSGRRVIDHPSALAFCTFQTGSRPETGLGFELRVLWLPAGDRALPDLLIIDEQESCSIESYGHGQFGDLEACVNTVSVRKHAQFFEDQWSNAIPVEHCLR